MIPGDFPLEEYEHDSWFTDCVISMVAYTELDTDDYDFSVRRYQGGVLSLYKKLEDPKNNTDRTVQGILTLTPNEVNRIFVPVLEWAQTGDQFEYFPPDTSTEIYHEVEPNYRKVIIEWGRQNSDDEGIIIDADQIDEILTFIEQSRGTWTESFETVEDRGQFRTAP